MLHDPRLKETFKKRLQEPRGDAELRPDIAGYSREVQELHKMHVTLTHLLRATTRNYGIPMPAAPLYPAEEFQFQQLAEELEDLDADIDAAMNKKK